MENIELFEYELEEVSVEQTETDLGEGQGEVRQDAAQGISETQYDEPLEEVVKEVNVYHYDEQLQTIINELVSQRESMETLQEYIEYKDMSIFEKELKDYTVTESIMMLMFFALLFGMLLKLIGGIITCRV